MNLVLVEPDEIDERGRVALTGRRARHVCGVLDARAGQTIRVGMTRGPIGHGELIARHSEPPRVELRVCWQKPPSTPPAVDLILAVPRPKALVRSLRAAASLGVRRIDLINAWRVDKSYFTSRELEPDRLRASLLVGCEQGMTTWLPDIHVHRLLMPFIRQHLSERLATRATRLVIAHPDAAQPIEDAVLPGGPGPIAVAIGPERGWIERELASFADLGAVPVTLCDSVLAVDTAVTVALAQLALLDRMSHR